MTAAAEHWLQRQLDAAPPLSPQQRDQLAELLRPVRMKRAAGESLSSGSQQQHATTSVPRPGDNRAGT